MRLAKIREEQAQGLRKKKEKKKQEATTEPPHTRRRPRDKKQPKPPAAPAEPNQFSELYELVRLLFQTKRVINGEEMIMYLDESSEEKEALMVVRRGLTEPEVCSKLKEMLAELETLKKENEDRYPRAVEANALDDWVVRLRKKERYFGN
jgi:hypothetical protein